ncbi:hypothetical protein F4553_001803 [Allocatelliglobosispora scoriae]|uniref:Uncharacterized protein n=1 Tax=Allocatelliglobosispora scoriae TaxID=643052 RepID=A0A841BJJ1_9ACTN|nr:hypothetical protein [Allocatelliglobosispora scoriae]MBB5868424.1 hypothetical protein [Allocatelliglobosispora scoriae]
MIAERQDEPPAAPGHPLTPLPAYALPPTLPPVGLACSVPAGEDELRFDLDVERVRRHRGRLPGSRVDADLKLMLVGTTFPARHSRLLAAAVMYSSASR